MKLRSESKQFLDMKMVGTSDQRRYKKDASVGTGK